MSWDYMGQYFLHFITIHPSTTTTRTHLYTHSYAYECEYSHLTCSPNAAIFPQNFTNKFIPFILTTEIPPNTSIFNSISETFAMVDHLLFLFIKFFCLWFCHLLTPPLFLWLLLISRFLNIIGLKISTIILQVFSTSLTSFPVGDGIVEEGMNLVVGRRWNTLVPHLLLVLPISNLSCPDYWKFLWPSPFAWSNSFQFYSPMNTFCSLLLI